MSDELDGMTWERWKSLPECKKAVLRDLSDLSPQLMGLDGWRVQVAENGITRRFIVGRSTGWRPCHLELKTKRSHGGGPASKHYDSVIPLYNARGLEAQARLSYFARQALKGAKAQ